MTEAPSPSDYKGRSRDPHWERELLDWLRHQPEAVRLAFLTDLVNYQEIVALQLSHKSLEARESFVTMLDFAISNRDASSIKFWLDAVVPRLGFRRTVDILLRLSASKTEGVAKALYWLPRYAASDADRVKLGELTEAVSPK
jgi:hypothetical protein